MVLLEKDELKRSTSFVLAKKIAEYDEWNLQNLNDYQAWLAEQAVYTWQVN
jgi:predicted transcriptional regulator